MATAQLPLHLLRSRAALLVCCMLVFCLTIVGLCGSNAINCMAVIAIDGVVTLAWVLSACALGSVMLRCCGITTTSGLFIATAGGLGLGVFSLLGLGLGLLGWLNHAVAIAFPLMSVLLFVIQHWQTLRSGLLHSRGRKPRSTESSAQPGLAPPAIKETERSSSWLLQPAGGAAWIWLVPVVSLAVAMVSASLMPGLLWKPLDPHPYDVTSYHLLVPREWYEGGRIVPLQHNVFSFFPFNVEMQFLLLTHVMGGPWAGMYACQFITVGYSVLMVLAVWGETSGSNDIGRTIGAAMAAVVPWAIMLAGVAYVESALMMYTALAVAWAVRAYGDRSSFFRAMLMSGVMAGFACGVKITAVPMLLLAVPVAVGFVMMVGRSIEFPARRIALGCGELVLAGSIVLSPWLIRNFIWSGNPIFPLAMSKLGQDHFSDAQVKRFVIAHSPVPAEHGITAKVRIMWNDVISHWEFGYVLLPAGLIAMLWGWRDRQMWIIGIVGVFVLVTWIGFTHLVPRFVVMIIPISALAIARVQWGQWGWPVGLLAMCFAAVAGWSGVMPVLCQWSNPIDQNGQRQTALIGFEDLPFMLPQELADARDHHQQVYMIGDAQAFLFQIPMTQLHYRSVFNVTTGTDDPIDAWAGPGVRGNANAVIAINTSEINRLHSTYYAVPGLPQRWKKYLPQTYFITGDKLPKKIQKEAEATNGTNPHE